MATEADDMLEMILDSADGFLAERHDRSRLRIGEVPPATAVDATVWRQMVDLGWLGLGVPEAQGGAGLDLMYSAALCERLGKALLPEPFIASALLPGALLAACPPSEDRARLLTDLVSGETALTVAWQERPGQLGFDGIETAVAQGTVTGRKLFVPMSLPAMTVLVVAREAGQPVIVAVAANAAWVTATGHRMGDGGRMAELALNKAELAGPVLARGPAAVHALDVALGRAMVALSAQLAGLAEGALALSLDYLRTRVQFGQPIGTFQVLQHLAVDLHLSVELAKASWRTAARLQENAPDDPATIAAVSAAKAVANKAARDTANAGVQFFGAMGFTEEADIGLYLRTALHWASWLGSESAHQDRFRAATRVAVAA